MDTNYELIGAREWLPDEQITDLLEPNNPPPIRNQPSAPQQWDSSALTREPPAQPRGRNATHNGRGMPVWVRGRGGANVVSGGNHANSARPRYQSGKMMDNIADKPDYETRSRNADKFAKTPSYSTAKNNRLDVTEWRRVQLQMLRHKPDPSKRFAETMIFLWPVDEFPLEESLGADLKDLDPIRDEFGYHIYTYDESKGYIRVDGDNHANIVEIVRRFRAKWCKLLATQTKLYLVQMPPVNIANAQVGIIKCYEPGSRAICGAPKLFGGRMDEHGLAVSRDRRNLLCLENESRLRNSVGQSLHGSRFIEGYVRMRVNFGTFLLDEYRVPADSNPRYSFEEFRTMLFNSRTKGHLIHGLDFKYKDGDLITRCSQASDILSPFDCNVERLEDTKPLYAVNFEFRDNDDSLLRLEAQFKQSRGSNMFEVSERRWVRLHGNDKRPPLQIGVVDFEKSDWQIEIKALDFQESSSIEQSLKGFAHSIQFQNGPSDGLRGIVGQRVTFSDSVRVDKLTEKTALRYRVTGTEYVFELARYDTYYRAKPGNMGVTRVNQMTEKPITTWGASIFSLEWDNQLGKNGDIRAGNTADWNASLNSFFPCDDDSGPTEDNAGFNKFIYIVNQIAHVLAPERKDSGLERVVENPFTSMRSTQQPQGMKNGPKMSWAKVVSS
ncbi:hypothetical protein FQN55_005871 [Onygenales sp. PD_40]|nr:hypothetical protein FQN55_005871 [Onygenales sp. PD_40]KAK2791875.1 hypothetical protein FQN52_004316 [Onygenales sp. PD_12]